MLWRRPASAYVIRNSQQSRLPRRWPASFIPCPPINLKIEDFLRRICAALELNHVPYMVTGSVASSIHGDPRSTNDLDVVIAPTREQLHSLRVVQSKWFGTPSERRRRHHSRSRRATRHRICRTLDQIAWPAGTMVEGSPVRGLTSARHALLHSYPHFARMAHIP